MTERLVVVGNGIAGVACVEQILKYAPKFDITIFDDETHGGHFRKRKSGRDRIQGWDEP